AGVELRAFRIDVCGQQYSLPSEQPDPAALDRHLRQLMLPSAAALCGAAVDVAPAVADAVEAHVESAMANARRRTVSGRRRSLRKRASLMTTAAMAERQRLAESLVELCDPDLDSDSPLAMICDVFALLAAELRDALRTMAESTTAIHQIARAFGATAAETSKRRSSTDAVFEFAAVPQPLDVDADADPDTT
ncbi:hypothetical protein H4R19_006598, partial [Coemansia spiralis]